MQLKLDLDKVVESTILINPSPPPLLHYLAGTRAFGDFVTQMVTSPPRSREEELAACKEKLLNTTESLREANEKLFGLYLRLVWIL